MTLGKNDISLVWYAIRSSDEEDRRAGRDAYINILRDVSFQEAITQGELSFVYNHPEFLELAKAYFRSEDKNVRRDGAIILAAIMDVLMYVGDTLEEREIEDIDQQAVDLFRSDDPDKIIDASTIFLAGHDCSNNDRAESLSENHKIYERTIDLYCDISAEDVQIVVTNVMCMLAAGHLENVLLPGTLNTAVAGLSSANTIKAFRSMVLLNAFTCHGETLGFQIYENRSITREIASFYVRMANHDEEGISARLLASLAEDKNRAAEIMESNGFLDAVIKRVSVRLYEELPIDLHDIHLIEVLAQNGQSGALVAHDGTLSILLELYSLTDRNVDTCASDEELEKKSMYGHGDNNFGEPVLRALIDNGQAEAVARYPAMIETAHEMFLCANPLANDFGYRLLERLDICGQHAHLVAKYPDITARMQAYAAPSDPIAKHRLGRRLGIKAYDV